MTTGDVSGREPVQIVEIIQPRCANTYGVAPCTASGPDARRCFNTRATCQDVPNFRSQPEALLSTDLVYGFGDTAVLNSFNRGADFFCAIDVRFPSYDTPFPDEGVIFEIGSFSAGFYVGVDRGELVMRAGDGANPVPLSGGTARIAVDVIPFSNKAVTLLVGVDVSASSISAWQYDAFRREVELIGTSTASSGFPFSPTLNTNVWTTTNGFNVGTIINSGVVLGESSVEFTGDIFQVRVYDATSAPDLNSPFSIPLRFSRGNEVDSKVPDAPHVIPSLNSVSTTPTRINLSGTNVDSTGLGNRALTRISFQDHPHTDRVVDPYLSGRDYDPLERGSFWSKWFVRNLFRYNLPIIIYEGYAGQSLSQMVTRSYVMTSTSGPTETGEVTIRGKDILTRVEDRKAQYPEASRGELSATINAAVTQLDMVGASVSDYPAPGTVRINNEVIRYTGVSAQTNGIVRLSGLTRGSDNTIAAQHDQGDKVQICVRYTNETPDNITSDILRNGATVAPQFFNTDLARAEREQFLAAYRLSALITEPTSAARLLSELQAQVGFYIWWDERQSLINFKAIRGFDEQVPLITDSVNFIENSFSVSDMPRNRISQVWFNYGLRSPVSRLDETASYRQVFVQADLPSETEEQYGEPSIRQIFSRWIESAALALGTASRIVVRYSTIPRQCRFRMDAKDREFWVGDAVRISHFLEVNSFGERLIRIWTILSAEEVVPGETVEYVAEDTTLYGRLNVILPNNEPDYDPNTSPFTGAFIGDNQGLLSDGTLSARIQ